MLPTFGRSGTGAETGADTGTGTCAGTPPGPLTFPPLGTTTGSGGVAGDIGGMLAACLDMDLGQLSALSLEELTQLQVRATRARPALYASYAHPAPAHGYSARRMPGKPEQGKPVHASTPEPPG